MPGACAGKGHEISGARVQQWHMDVLCDDTSLTGAGKHGLGIAIDLGTTTIAAQIVDLATGNVLASRDRT